MATRTLTAPATVVAVGRTTTVRGREFPASVVRCDCAGCEGCSVLVPSVTIDGAGSTLALHNYVAQRRVLGFSVVTA